MLFPKGFWRDNEFIKTNETVKYLFWDEAKVVDGKNIKFHQNAWVHVFGAIQASAQIKRILDRIYSFNESTLSNFTDAIETGLMLSFNFKSKGLRLVNETEELGFTNIDLYRKYFNRYKGIPEFITTFKESWQVNNSFPFKKTVDEILRTFNHTVAPNNDKVKMVNYPTFRDKQIPKVHDLSGVKDNKDKDWNDPNNW